MPEVATRQDARHLEMLEAMTECAFALSMAAGEMAKRAGDDTKLFLAACNEFRNCAFAVRMGIRLAHGALAAARLGRPAAEPAEPAEHERLEQQRPERDDSREAPERDEVERERDRDYEPVSLPQFLKTLGVAAANAEQLRDDLPPHIRDNTLPTLQGLLREANTLPDAGPRSRGAAPAVAVLARPRALAPAGRAHLLTSTVTPVARLPRATPPPRRPSG